jgi:hypothetical protein
VLRRIADRPRPPAAVAALPAGGLDADAGQSLADLVGDLGPAPLLTFDERAAASRWADVAGGVLRQRVARD